MNFNQDINSIEFKTAIDIDLLFRLTSTDNKIEMGVYPVIFGFRVRAGFIGNQYYEIDYCCGNKQEDVEFIYSVVKYILEQREYSPDIFTEFPSQYKKPFFNDTDNFPKLLKLAGENLPKIKLPDIHEAKRKYLLEYL